MPPWRLLLAAALLLLHAAVAFAGKGEIRFVETDVDLREDGSAVVAYTVQWTVLSGELHGFYFQGNDRLRVGAVAEESYAVDSAGRRYGLSIEKVASDKWDIVLARGAGVSSGTVTYVFYFETSFARAGYVAPHRDRPAPARAARRRRPARIRHRRRSGADREVGQREVQDRLPAR